MANTTKGGNKPRTGIVETKLYSGRAGTIFKTKDEHGNQGPADDQHGPKYDNIVKSDWRRGDDVGGSFGSGVAGVTNRKGFDRDKTRAGNDAPISTGGANCEKSPFSAAHKAAKAESDWSSDYKPRSYKDKP
jgi:hypothetical protein